MNRPFFIILILLLVGGSFLFWWFQLRPSGIRKYCLEDSVNGDLRAMPYLAGEDLRIQENKDYRGCLVRHGMAAEDF